MMVRLSTHCTAVSRGIPANHTNLDLSLPDIPPPPSGPARVVWAREVAALEERLRVKGQRERLTGSRG